MPDHDTIYFRISKNNRGIKPANTLCLVARKLKADAVAYLSEL
jgi:hypothetical protein